MKNMDDLVFYTEPTTTSTTTKKKFYEYPKGWNKKKKENKIKRFFRIMYNTFANRLDKLEVSDHRRYDSWIMDIKIGIAVGIICLLLCSIVVNSNFGSEKATEYKKESTFIDKAIDYFFSNKDSVITTTTIVAPEVKTEPVISIDSINALIRKTDSILKIYAEPTRTDSSIKNIP